MKNPAFLFLFFFLLREGSPPTPSAFVCTIVMASLLMSLELTVCNEWRLEAPAEPDCAAEWGTGGVLYGWKCMLCAGICACRTLTG